MTENQVGADKGLVGSVPGMTGGRDPREWLDAKRGAAAPAGAAVEVIREWLVYTVVLPHDVARLLAGSVLEELAAKGLAVVPVAETREEYRVRYHPDAVPEQWFRANSAAKATTLAVAHHGEVMHATVHYGPWEPVDDA